MSEIIYLNKPKEAVRYKIFSKDQLYFTKVLIHLFSGFDSKTGMKKAEKELLFRPPTPHSRYSKVHSVHLNFVFDEVFRDSLYNARADTASLNESVDRLEELNREDYGLD